MKSLLGPALLWAACGFPSFLGAQQIERVIPNSLNETWPLEHVYFDFSPSEIKGPMTCTIQGVTRPTQEERLTVDGKDVVRLWTVATIAMKDDQGNVIPKDGERNIKRVKALFQPGKVASPLSLREEGGFYIIDNGIYEFKVRKYPGVFAEPTPLEKIPHWIGGMRVKGTEKWDGRSEFQGPPLMKSSKTEIVSQGPVHIDLKITLESEQPAELKGKFVEAVPLTVGKQSFRYAPNSIPREKLPMRDNHYEALVRFVAEDPWIDVAQRYDFPRDPAIKPWGFSQEYVALGGKEGMPLDTAMWLRWFEWDKFGGNTDLQFLPATMRPEQKGRPFTMLRPLWNQGPGGSQEFFLTTGGKTPPWNNETKKNEDPSGKYPTEAPAIGVVATFPSKWVGPFAQTIVCRAENGDSGNWRMPMVQADNARGGYVPGMRYGQRAFAICVGPRQMFDDTGRINSLVRRHTDWTLVALINRYILEWSRDPAKAGPNLIVTRARVEQLRNDFKAGKDTVETRTIREAMEEMKPKEDESRKLDAELKAKEEEITRMKDAKADPASITAAETERKTLAEKVKAAKSSVSGDDADILRLIVDGTSKEVRAPDSSLWRERRYQDDFLNPTQRTVRSIAEMRRVDLFANGTPVGGGNQAAMAYIICDPDAWMGWRNGWMPGNPNFHTDKYMSALYLGGGMYDHPHAKEWVEFARLNYDADSSEVMLPPDGVGVECPGYAAYAMDLMLPAAVAFENLGYGNLVASNPSYRGTGVWHRKLLTPVDSRLGRRHEAPIGDTHRWDAGMTDYLGDLGRFYREKDPKFAAEMMSTWRYLSKSGVGTKRSKFQLMLSQDLGLPKIDMQEMDWSSQSFYGFGAILRTNFGTPRETFLSYKAGSTRGHNGVERRS